MTTFTKYTSDLEESYFRECFAAASKAGHTLPQAEDCDDGDLNCPDCPFFEPDNEYPPEDRDDIWKSAHGLAP